MSCTTPTELKSMKFLMVCTTIMVSLVDTRETTRTRTRNEGTTRTKMPWNKNNNQDNKPWQNKGKKSWDNKKEPKSKEICFTFSKDVKYFCPAVFDESVFAAICKLLQEKVEQAKKAGVGNAKTINSINVLWYCWHTDQA